MIVHKLYRWSLDRVNGRFISGWCFHRLHKTRPVSIAAAADTTLLGEFTNNRYRPDLVTLNLHPDGVCGFDFSFPDSFDPADFDRLYLYFDSSKTPVAAIDCGNIDMLRPHHRSPVCFMHIPKTAGTSFNAFARCCYAGSRFQTHIERIDRDQRAAVAAGADFIAGHLPLYEMEQLGISSCAYYSIIREPFSQLHSHLNYVRGVRPGAGVEAHYAYRHNETVKRLSDKLNDIDFSEPDEIRAFVEGLADFELDFFDNIQTRYFLDYRPGRVKPDDLDKAVTNLKRFRSIGLTEAYDAFRDRFCEDLGLDPQSQDLRSNRSASYRLFDLGRPAVREVLRPLVVHDLDLYAYVSEQFWQKTAHLDRS
ncbi:MAG: hypothetical protein LJE64_15420 [Desulfofustis sp.]|nr:hypothetical protein [Desulfofustis sp.]